MKKHEYLSIKANGFEDGRSYFSRIDSGCGSTIQGEIESLNNEKTNSLAGLLAFFFKNWIYLKGSYDVITDNLFAIIISKESSIILSRFVKIKLEIYKPGSRSFIFNYSHLFLRNLDIGALS